MRSPVFTGTCPALITPFDHEGRIDYERLAAQIEVQIAAGVDAVCICGTTGESATLTDDEHIDLIGFCVKQVNRRVKVIAGTGSNSTSSALHLTRCAENMGADAALIVTPYYNKATQTGIIRHYEYIAKRTNIPMILYNIPSRTGLSIAPETYRILSAIPNINGVKEASGDNSLVLSIRSRCDDDFFIWSGNDDQVVSTMSLGAIGAISAAANLIPDVMVRITHLCLSGKFPAAARIQIEYAELIRALFAEVNPIPVKAAMSLTGGDSGVLRLPLCKISEQNLDVLRSVMIQKELLPQ